MLIIFDLDDTLIDTSGCIQPIKLSLALEKMIEAGLEMRMDFKSAYNLLIKINETSASGKEALRKFLGQIGAGDVFLPVGERYYYGSSNDIYDSYGGYGQKDFPVSSLADAQKVLVELNKEQDLVLVSFGIAQEQLGKLKKAKIDSNLFKKIIFTEGYDKTKSYELVCKELACSPSQVLVVGDKFKTDLLPARRLGMRTVHFQWGRGKVYPPVSGEVDYSISSLKELLRIAKELSKRGAKRGNDTLPKYPQKLNL